MVQRTSRYTLLVFNLLLLSLGSLPVTAQQNDKDKRPAIEYPLFHGLFISADLYGPASYGIGSDFLVFEAAAELDLKNRYFPIVEVGYGSTDTWGDKGIHYKSSAPFFRAGMNYNFFFKKQDRFYLYGGFRYALSSFTYDVYNLTADDPIWGDAVQNPNLNDPIWGGSLPYNYKGQKATIHWFELLAGVRVYLYKNFFMGWALRYKSRLSESKSSYGDPWFVPGFGQYDKSRFGITYTITYKIPL
ncbi:MAG: DUF6048 family protein [Bacteroides sp.]|nr:DUF6048 family protein [Bacteroides sp.]